MRHYTNIYSFPNFGEELYLSTKINTSYRFSTNKWLELCIQPVSSRSDWNPVFYTVGKIKQRSCLEVTQQFKHAAEEHAVNSSSLRAKPWMRITR